MSPQEVSTVLLREARRWWPAVVLPAVIAAAAAGWSLDRATPTYRVVTTMVTVPIVQWDETFLGTSLVRDGGNPSITAATLAAVLDSPRALATTATELGGRWTPAAVDRAVSVAAVPDTNLVEITARASDPQAARRISAEFADAVLADRWATISDELDDRIAALQVITAADPDAGEAATRLQTLTVIRGSGADPTLRIHAVDRAAEDDSSVPGVVVVGLAALGGAGIGVLCALGAAQSRRRRTARTGDDDEMSAADG